MTAITASDRDLVGQILAGRREVFSLLVERHLHSALAIARARLLNPADADDAVQEAFLRAFERLHTLREPAKFGPWLLTIARHEAVRLVVKGRSTLGADPSAAPDPAAADSNPEQHELHALLRDHISKLPEQAREVLLLHYFAGRSTREIAALLEIRQGAVLKRLQRAREQLAETMLRDLEATRPGEASITRQVVRIVALTASLTIPAAMANAATVSTVAKAGTTRYLFTKSFVAVAASITALNVASLWWIASHYLGEQVRAQRQETTPDATLLRAALDARDLLRQIREAHNWAAPMVKHVGYVMTAEYKDAPEKRERVEMNIDAFQGEVRAARRGTSRHWEGTDESSPPHEQFNLETWDGQRFYSLGKVLSSAHSYWGGGTSEAPKHAPRLRAIHTGAELMGVLYGDLVPYYDVLNDAQELTVVPDDSTIPGISTYRTEAKTKRGVYRVWVDPAQDYHLRKAILEKSADDLDWDDIPLSKQEWNPMKTLKYTLTNEEFESFEGRIFPVLGHTVTECVYTTVSLNRTRGAASSIQKSDIHISSIDLNPDANALRAFVPDAPPNTIVTDWDNNRQVVWIGTGISDDESLLKAAQAQLEELMRVNPERPKTGK
jgi:RNA polymerase sigma-70 factor (ECF subfamily)